MGVSAWAAANWFDLLQSIGIIAGLLFTAAAVRVDAKAKRVDNLMTITRSHREIWSELYARPQLARVMDADADVLTEPITREEEWFVRFLILHLNSVYHALRGGVLQDLEGLERDVALFFSLPVPKAVWEKVRPVQDAGFVRFVEGARIEVK